MNANIEKYGQPCATCRWYRGDRECEHPSTQDYDWISGKMIGYSTCESMRAGFPFTLLGSGRCHGGKLWEPKRDTVYIPVPSTSKERSNGKKANV